jgi:hypothetical protein
MRAAIVASILLFAPTASAGYSHYWKWKIVPPPPRMDACITEMEKVTSKRRDLLADVDQRVGNDAVFRSTEPFADAGSMARLSFNGIGLYAHETFSFPLAAFDGDPKFSFIKTLGKPYDEVVTACLIVARDCFDKNELEISSDGSWAEWQKGAKLYESVFARPAKSPLAEPIEAPAIAPEITDDERKRRRKHMLGFAAIVGIVVIGLVLLSSRQPSE